MSAFNLYTCSTCRNVETSAQSSSALFGWNAEHVVNALYSMNGIFVTVL
ncbi:MAG: hypothetical protein WCI23_05210 [Chlorobiaceae bacterium]